MVIYRDLLKGSIVYRREGGCCSWFLLLSSTQNSSQTVSNFVYHDLTNNFFQKTPQNCFSKEVVLLDDWKSIYSAEQVR